MLSGTGTEACPTQTRVGTGLPSTLSRAMEASAGRMPKRSGHAVSGGQDVRSERPPRGYRQPRAGLGALRGGDPLRDEAVYFTKRPTRVSAGR